MVGLLVLGGLQGVLGWYMVMSGLSQRTDVSHFRLSAHLLLALTIMSALLWVALDLRRLGTTGEDRPSRLTAPATITLAILFVQLLFGAWVAGLNAGQVANTWPDISPDGRTICFSSSRAGDFDLYLMDADGGNVRRIVEAPGMDTRPAWSPDGRRIAFTSNRDGDYEIYLVNADGANARRITHRPGKDDYAVWHPAGDRLLVVSEVAGKSDLWLVNVDAGAE